MWVTHNSAQFGAECGVVATKVTFWLHWSTPNCIFGIDMLWFIISYFSYFAISF